MDAKVTKISCRKAFIALTVSLACFLVYVLACVSSPVTWSPDSSKIALLVASPDSGKDSPDIFAIFTYDIATGKRVLLDKSEKEEAALSAPSWSPDGKWIAYYRIVPPAEKAEANCPADSNNSVAGVGRTDIHTANSEQAKKQNSVVDANEALFKGIAENKMLPPGELERVMEEMDGKKTDKLCIVKLMLVTPDGRQRKVLRIFESDSEGTLMMIIGQPQWSNDSKRIFAAISAKGIFLISSLDIDTGETYIHGWSVSGGFSVSPDGKWIASLTGDEHSPLLALAKTDGSMQKYIKIVPKLSSDSDESFFLRVSWSADSRRVALPLEEGFGIIDTDTGGLKTYQDPNAGVITPAFLPRGNKLAYVEVCNEPNSSSKGKLVIKSINLNNGKRTDVMVLPELDRIGGLSISPNGKMMLVRGAVKDPNDEEKSVLIFWNGKKQKIVETNSWLNEVFPRKLDEEDELKGKK